MTRARAVDLAAGPLTLALTNVGRVVQMRTDAYMPMVANNEDAHRRLCIPKSALVEQRYVTWCLVIQNWVSLLHYTVYWLELGWQKPP